MLSPVKTVTFRANLFQMYVITSEDSYFPGSFIPNVYHIMRPKDTPSFRK